MVDMKFHGYGLKSINLSNMIKFNFKYNREAIATIDNVSRFSNKEVWNKFEEAVTQQIKHILINELGDIREKLENGNVVIECNFNPVTQDFDYSYIAGSDLADLIKTRLK